MTNLTIDEIREIIADKALRHIERGTQDNLVVQTFPGSGKTTSIMKAIDSQHYNWIYLSPFHDIIVENLKFSRLRNYEFVHLKGRKQPGVCLIPEYRELAQKGININPFCETRCPYKNEGCPYFRTRKKIESFPQSWAGVHSHVPTYLQTYFYNNFYEGSMMYHYYDVIIIDEFPFNVLYDQIICKRDDIDRLREVINHIEVDSEEKEVLQKVLDELTLATGSIDINYTKILSIFENHRGLDFEKFIKHYDATLLYLVRHEFIQYPPKKILFMLKEIYKQNPDRDTIEWNIYKHSCTGWKWNPEGIYMTVSNIDKFQRLPLPVIALDATAKIDAWNTLLGGECNSEEIDLEYKNIYQLRTRARYPVRSWVTRENSKLVLSNTGKRLADLIIEICKRKEYDVLLCSNKRIQKLLTEYLQQTYHRENYEFANYYNLRSRNSFYESCDTCIITHEPNIPPLQTNILRNITGWDEEIIQNLMTESEIFQAIGRIRQNIKETPFGREREDVEVFILPGANGFTRSKLLPEVTMIPYERMLDGNLITVESAVKELIKYCGGTNIRHLWQLCNDFVTKRALKNILKKLYLNGYITNYRGYIEWDEEAEQQRNKVKYKRNV